jgi:hypothetical protein
VALTRSRFALLCVWMILSSSEDGFVKKKKSPFAEKLIRRFFFFDKNPKKNFVAEYSVFYKKLRIMNNEHIEVKMY